MAISGFPKIRGTLLGSLYIYIYIIRTIVFAVDIGVSLILGNYHMQSSQSESFSYTLNPKPLKQTGLNQVTVNRRAFSRPFPVFTHAIY